jgi:dTDP-4-dehydrorhamnose 3,5-epimerase
MKLIATELEGAYIVEQDLYPDNRGWFMEIFHSGKFSQNALPDKFVQE